MKDNTYSSSGGSQNGEKGKSSNDLKILRCPVRKHLRPVLEKSRAVRAIPKASKGHFVGELVFIKTNGKPQRVGFASHLEYRTLVCLLYREDFADIEEQLAALRFQHPRGGTSNHHFDFRLTRKCGQRVCISVKPERIAKTFDYQATTDAVKKAAIGNICDAVATVTERNISPVELHNAELFHAARQPDQDIDAIVLSELAKLEITVSINEFLERVGLGGRGFFSVARAIRFGHAGLLTTEKICGKTLIERGAAA